MKLNLEAATAAEQRVKAYLEENASEMLAEKINNGVRISKDGRELLNKKTLKGFMRYACDEAKKQAEKGANSACIDDETVFGWAIHYFEEDSIEGTLHNADGTEYKIQPSVTAKAPAVKYSPPKPQPKPQLSLFDMMAEKSPEEEQDPDDEPTDEDYEEAEQVIREQPKQQASESPMYRNYLAAEAAYPQALVMMRVGDFYEAFGDHARVLAEELELTLTGRDIGLEERVPMVGIPYHASETYFEKVLSNGHRLVIVENGEACELSAKQNVDLETGEILSAEEMHAFDGDIEEPDQTDDEPEFDLSAFDTEALAVLDEMFGNEITLR